MQEVVLSPGPVASAVTTVLATLTCEASDASNETPCLMKRLSNQEVRVFHITLRCGGRRFPSCPAATSSKAPTESLSDLNPL